MTEMELQQTKDGSFVMQPKDYRLYVGTGQEAEQHWPDLPADEEIMPLLDMNEAWQMIIREQRLPAKKAIEGDILAVNAKIIVKEISYHLLASTTLLPKESVGSAKDNAAASRGDPTEETADTKSDEVDLAKRADESKSEPDGASDKGGTEDQETGDVEKVKSIYGASLLLKLQWEDKTTQKTVPHRTYQELALFISDITTNLDNVLQQNENAGQAVLDTLAFELTLLLLARYMDGIETGIQVLQESAFALLTLCAERANPKEMCMALRTFTRKVDNVYVDATAYLILQPLLTLWTKLVHRIPRKRHYFLNDLISFYEHYKRCAETFEMEFVGGDGDGVEKPGRIAQVWDIMLDFYEKLAKVQLEQREKSEDIMLRVDELGRALPVEQKPESEDAKDEGRDSAGRIACSGKRDAECTSLGNSNGCTFETTRSAQGTDRQASGKAQHPPQNVKATAATMADETRDWVNERAAILAKVLLMQTALWSDLYPPEGDERVPPHQKRSKSKRAERAARERAEISEKNEQSLLRCHRLFEDLGWMNPVMVCQIASSELQLHTCSKTDELFRQHIKSDVRSKKERKNTLYSTKSVGLYLCGRLRPKTQKLLLRKDTANVDEYMVDVTGTGFDLLDPFFAFDTVLPYVMALVPESARSVSLAGVLTARAFLDRIPENGFTSYDDVLRLRCGTNAMGREVNVLGLAHHLARAVASCDDPKHRRVTYECLQTLLRKVRDAEARYTVVECLFHDCKRVAVAGQLVTEMKDALRYSDIVAERGNDGIWTEGKASALKTRFVEVILPKYFSPRKDLLTGINAIVCVAGAVFWLGGSDKRLLGRLAEGDKERMAVEKRREFVKAHCKMGRECIRALAAVAEHDRKIVPTSKLARESAAEAHALFAASGRTLNNCMVALNLLKNAEDFL